VSPLSRVNLLHQRDRDEHGPDRSARLSVTEQALRTIGVVEKRVIEPPSSQT
jgi:hypothetical protein